MLLINKLLYFKRIFIIIITSVLLLNTILILKSHSVSYKISEIEVSEEFGLEFNKEKVFDKAFLLAFKDLISMTVTSSDQLKLKNIDIFTIKSLIDSFNVKNEKFINEIYYAEFNVYFNKKNTLKFFENKYTPIRTINMFNKNVGYGFSKL